MTAQLSSLRSHRLRSPLLLLIVLLCALALVSEFASASIAATFTVNSTADMFDANPGDGVCETAAGNGVCTLRAAVQEANALAGADMITVPAGTYSLSNGTLSVLSNVNISGAGRDSTSIRGVVNLSGTGNLFTDGVVTISNMTIRDGRAFNGGGITNAGELTLQNVAVLSNRSPFGGGILNLGGAVLTVRDSLIENNTGSNGAGIQNVGPDGALYIYNSIIRANVADNTGLGVGGGGILVNGTATISDSIIDNNRIQNSGGGKAFPAGGGIMVGGDPLNKLRINNSKVINNTADDQGGGLTVYAGSVTIGNSTFADNKADNGAAIWTGNATLAIDGSTFAGNQAEEIGGAIFNNASATIRNSTFYKNRTAPTGGLWAGAIYNQGNMMLINITIANNSALGGGGISYGDGSNTSLLNVILAYNSPGNCLGPVTSLGHNLESANSCGLNAAGDMINTNPLLGPLADNGGSTHTMALLPGSPAIDAGSNAQCPSVDQRNVRRPQDGDLNGPDECDIGAYEVAIQQLFVPIVFKNP